MPKYKGMCRIKGKNSGGNMVRVTDGDLIFADVDEESYKRSLFYPQLEDLPWCDGSDSQSKSITKSAMQRVFEFGSRLDNLVFAGKMTPKKRSSYMDHLHASVRYGDTEIASHERMTDEELCN